MLLPAAVDTAAGPSAWLGYEGRWGREEIGRWSAPTGPNTTRQWRSPLTWEEGLRSRSINLDERDAAGLSPIDVVCGLARASAWGANLDATNPVAARAIFGVVVALIAVLLSIAWRTLSVASDTRRWWRTAITLAVLGAIPIVVAPALGFALLLTLHWSLARVLPFTAVLFAALLPLPFVGATLLVRKGA